jgi:predicted ester cyclase
VRPLRSASHSRHHSAQARIRGSKSSLPSQRFIPRRRLVHCLTPNPAVDPHGRADCAQATAQLNPRCDPRSPPDALPLVRVGRDDLRSLTELESNKELVRRLVDLAVNQQNLDALDEVAEGSIAETARIWIGPFRDSFPDFRMEVVDLIAEGDKVVAHFKCSGTHLGTWMGNPPTGRRFEGVDEIYVFHVRNGRLAAVTAAVEDNLTRLRQLGLDAPGG